MFFILSVDDSDDTLMMQEMALTRAGHTVVTSMNGEDALNKISTLPRLDLILLDVQMNGMSGPELLKRIRIQHPNIYTKVPVVFVSAQTEPPPVRGAAGWIRKMTNIDEFVASVEKFLSYDDSRKHEGVSRAE